MLHKQGACFTFHKVLADLWPIKVRKFSTWYFGLENGLLRKLSGESDGRERCSWWKGMAPVFLTFAFDLLVVLDFSAGSVADVDVVVDADGSPSSFHSLACFSSRRLSCKEIGILIQDFDWTKLTPSRNSPEIGIFCVDYKSTSLLLLACPNLTQPNLTTLSGAMVSRPPWPKSEPST